MVNDELRGDQHRMKKVYGNNYEEEVEKRVDPFNATNRRTHFSKTCSSEMKTLVVFCISYHFRRLLLHFLFVYLINCLAVRLPTVGFCANWATLLDFVWATSFIQY